jgi:hypothetical protein
MDCKLVVHVASSFSWKFVFIFLLFSFKIYPVFSSFRIEFFLFPIYFPSYPRPSGTATTTDGEKRGSCSLSRIDKEIRRRGETAHVADVMLQQSKSQWKVPWLSWMLPLPLPLQGLTLWFKKAWLYFTTHGNSVHNAFPNYIQHLIVTFSSNWAIPMHWDVIIIIPNQTNFGVYTVTKPMYALSFHTYSHTLRYGDFKQILGWRMPSSGMWCSVPLFTFMAKVIHSSKMSVLTRLQGVTSQKTAFFIVTTMKTSNLTKYWAVQQLFKKFTTILLHETKKDETVNESETLCYYMFQCLCVPMRVVLAYVRWYSTSKYLTTSVWLARQRVEWSSSQTSNMNILRTQYTLYMPITLHLR